MPPSPPSPDLLIVGGLTVDRFADGSSAPGGSVLHSGLAAAREGARVGILTVCGEEPAAREGLHRLAAVGQVHRQPAPRSITYRHEESSGQRVLVFESGTQPLAARSVDAAARGRVALLAPIADELPVDTMRAVRSALAPRRSVCLIQGWLRRLNVGEPAAALPLDEVDPELWRELAGADAIVVSTEDFAETTDPFVAAAELRAHVGPRPLVVVTLGVDGFLLDDPAAPDVVASQPRRVVTGVPTVGAGDTFGAAFALRLGDGADPQVAAIAGGDAVIRMLESRRPQADG